MYVLTNLARIVVDAKYEAHISDVVVNTYGSLVYSLKYSVLVFLLTTMTLMIDFQSQLDCYACSLNFFVNLRR
jgi:hypothetical protein